MPIETLGVYRPQVHVSSDKKMKTVEWSVDRLKYWLGVGAVPSKSAVRLMTQGGILPPDSKYHPRPRLPVTNVPSTQKLSLSTTH